MIDVFSYDVITQAIGVLASAFVVFSFSRKQDNHLKIYLVLGNILFICHFFMLGAYSGMLVNIINALRVGSSIKFHKSNKMMFFFMGSYVVAGLFIFEQAVDLLPIFSGLLGTFSMFKLSGIKLRLLGMLGSSAWLSYAIVFNSIGGMITETSVLILNSTTIYRLMGDEKKNEQNT